MNAAMMLLADGRFPAGGHAHSAGVEAACADGRIVDEPTLAAFVEGRVRTIGLVDAALAAATTLVLRACSTEADVRAALAVLDAEADARIAAPPLRAASRRLGRQLVRVTGRCWPDATLAVVTDALPAGVHQAVAWGAVGVAAGLGAAEVAGLCVHHAVTTPAQAAVRLLGLDPFGVAALTARLARVAAAVTEEATAAARRALATENPTSPVRPATATEPDATGPDATENPTTPVRPATATEPGGAEAGGPGRRPVPDDGGGSAGPAVGLRQPGDGWMAGLADLPALGGPLVEIAAMEHAAWDVRMFAT